MPGSLGLTASGMRCHASGISQLFFTYPRSLFVRIREASQIPVPIDLAQSIHQDRVALGIDRLRGKIDGFARRMRALARSADPSQSRNNIGDKRDISGATLHR